MDASITRITLGSAALVCALAWTPVAAPGSSGSTPAGGSPAADFRLRPYEARYAIYRNGRLTGKAEITLRRQADRWVIQSEGSGTHGLARILAARDSEEVHGQLRDGRFRPLRYTRQTRVAGIDNRWDVEFDWPGRTVHVAHDRGDPLVLDMVGDSLDPLSLKLEMRQRLAEPDAPLEFQMVEEDEIDAQNFRELPREWLETSLGCLLTTPVEKIRVNSRRYTRAWHAPELNYIEVRVQHGKTGGNHLEMRINELDFDGNRISPRPGCAALQAAGQDIP